MAPQQGIMGQGMGGQGMGQGMGGQGIGQGMGQGMVGAGVGHGNVQGGGMMGGGGAMSAMNMGDCELACYLVDRRALMDGSGSLKTFMWRHYLRASCFARISGSSNIF